MAGNKNSGNRNSVETLNYKELLKLGIEHLTSVMMYGTTEERTKVSLVIIGKAIPQAVEHSGDLKLTWADILKSVNDRPDTGTDNRA